MKICRLINYTYPVIGGEEIQTLRLSGQMISMGHSVLILTRRLKGTVKHEVIDTVPVHRTRVIGQGKLASLVFMLTSFVFLVAHRKEYDLIHVNILSGHAITAVLIKKLLGKKVVLAPGGGGLMGDVNLSTKTLGGRLKMNVASRNIDLFLCITDEIKDELMKIGIDKDKIKKIDGIGVDTAAFKPVMVEEKKQIRIELGLKDVLSVVYVGRLHKGKGLDVLLEAWKSVNEELNDARLLLVGEGELKEMLRNQAEELGIGRKLDFIGETRKVYKYLQASDVFVLPSLAEGLSNAILEAMSCGIPIVVTSIGGAREIIENNKNGILVKAGDARELSENIISLLKNKSLANQIGVNERRTIEERFSLIKVTTNILDVYGEIGIN